MIKQILFLLFLQIPFLGWSQPGGGGGLQILEILDSNGFGIVSSDTSYRFDLWSLRSYGPDARLDDAWPGQQGYSTLIQSESILSLVLPPKNMRLRICHYTDTMLIDFYDLAEENGAGFIPICESIQFMPGYWQWKLTDLNRKIEMNHILNKSNAPILQSAGVLQFSKNIPSDFEAPENWSRKFLLQTAINKIMYLHDPGKAFYYLDLAESHHQSKEERNELVYYRAVALDSLERDQEAINLLLSIDWKSLEPFMQYQLIDLFTQQGRYQESVEIYNVLCSKRDLHFCIERANYKARYLKDFEGAKNDLNDLIADIPDDHMKNRSIGSNEFSTVYAAKGNVCMQYGAVDDAIYAYFKAVEFYPSGLDIVTFVDSVTHLKEMFPKREEVAKLYFVTLFRNLQLDMTSSEKQLQQAPEVKKALANWASLNPKDKEFNFWAGQWYYYQKDYAEAERAFSKAIKFDPVDFRFYMHRYLAKVQLSGELKSSAEQDRLKSIELANNWKYQR